MSFERALFQTLMPSTVTIAGRSSHNSYGEPSYGAATSYRARVVANPRYVRGEGNQTIRIASDVWIASTGGTITVDDRITLPDGTTPPILMVQRFGDADGGHHVHLALGA